MNVMKDIQRSLMKTKIMWRSKSKSSRILCGIVLIVVCIPVLVYRLGDFKSKSSREYMNSAAHRSLEGLSNQYYDVKQDSVHYDKNLPLIWIGGVPRSGTTLARVMLDAHPDIRCGEETRVIPRMLSMHGQMLKSPIEKKRLDSAKVTEEVLNNALGSYILQVIVGHGESAPHLCNKDPFTLRSMTRLTTIFPNSKFLLMVRDGRATVHSIVSRRVTIKGFDHTSYRGGLRDWNKAMNAMWQECRNAGPERCLLVYYEQLVLHPKGEMKKILNFLNIPWDERVVHHEKTIGQAGGISLSEKELSTDQVDKPVNIGALTKWVDHIPEDVRRDVNQIAPMLRTLGYDTEHYPPSYGEPDVEVLEQSKKLGIDTNGLKNP